MSKVETTRRVYCPNRGGMKVICETPDSCAGGIDCRRGTAPVSATSDKTTHVWRVIDTAPRDGTDIIVFRPGCKPSAYIPLVGTDYFKRGQWMNSNAASQPTMWMPLPEPPQ